MTHSTVKLKDLQYRSISLIAPDAPLGEAIRQMENDGPEKAVVMQGQMILGVLSARDRLRAFHRKTPLHTPVRELMSPIFCVLDQDTSFEDACSQLLEQAGADLVITDDSGKPLGFVDEAELLRIAIPLSHDPLANTKLVRSLPATPEQNNRPRESESCEIRSSGKLSSARRTVRTARDVTERGKANKQSRTLKRQADLISRFATALINLPANSSDGAVSHTLMQMGKLARVDRAYIFRYNFDADITCNTHEWCAPGISPQIENLQAVPLTSIPDWVSAHKRAESLVVNDVCALPRCRLRDILEAQDIKSVVSMPILGSDGCIGFLGFDSVRSNREYGPEDLELLSLFARTLANYHERVNAEQKLANSEANFHAFFDQTQDLLFVLSHEGIIIQCNKQAAERLGYSKDELCEQSVLELHPDEHHCDAARIVAAMAEGRIDNYAIPMQTRSGQLVPVETNVVVGQWNGRPALFIACRDLSEITASEEKFSKAFHLSPMPMAISELQQGKFLEVNEAFFNVTGYGIKETIGNKVSAMGLFVDPDQKAYIIKQLQLMGQMKNIELPLRTKQGNIVYGLFNAALLELQGRQVMITQMLDITARKAAEEALANERLHLRTLINAQTNLVWLQDPDGVYLACNSLFESLYGHPESEILGKTDVDFVKKERADYLRENYRAVIAAGKPCVREEKLTFSSNGYSGLFETTKTPIFNADARLIGVLGVSRDITNARHAEQERLRMERELQQAQKMEALGQLTGGVAHEFNNMLAIIMGYTDLLRNKLGTEADSSTNSWLHHIDVAGVRAKELVRQLLSFSSPNDKQPKRINLEAGVRKAIVLSQGSLPSSIEIDYRSSSELPDVLLDMGELQQMLTNLLVNARDAMDGKGRIEITLQQTRHTGQECQLCHTLIEGRWVELNIADNGPGIHPEKLSRIFEPFYTTKAVGKGTGLGLSLVRSIMEHNGGHILLDSQLGEGTRFRLLFPPLECAIQKSSPVLKRVETPSLRGEKVLVVDDEPALTEFLQEALENQGLQVVAINNSREALSLLFDSEQQFDLLVTDQTMPGMLGTELAIQAKNRLADLKVILCTGHSDQVNTDNAAELGIDSFLEKPVGIQDIVIAIDELSK